MRGGLYRSGRYEVRSATMLDLVRTAYNVDANNVAAVRLMDKIRFDIIAKAPGDSTPEKSRVMLRNSSPSASVLSCTTTQSREPLTRSGREKKF